MTITRIITIQPSNEKQSAINVKAPAFSGKRLAKTNANSECCVVINKYSIKSFMIRSVGSSKYRRFFIELKRNQSAALKRTDLKRTDLRSLDHRRVDRLPNHLSQLTLPNKATRAVSFMIY